MIWLQEYRWTILNERWGSSSSRADGRKHVFCTPTHHHQYCDDDARVILMPHDAYIDIVARYQNSIGKPQKKLVEI